MSLISAAVHGSTGSYEIANSIRLDGADDYLIRTPASAGNRKTWVWAGRVKRGKLGVNQVLLSAGTIVNGSSEAYFSFYFNASDQLVIFNRIATGNDSINALAPANRRDPSGWYDIVLAIDTTQAVNSNGVKLWVNGVAQTLTFTSYTQNADTFVNATVAHNYGRLTADAYGGSFQYFDGYLAHLYLLSGQVLDPSYFGYTDATTGQWRPKAFSGTFGTNACDSFLKFDDGSSTTTLGYDRSGNGNNWTLTNMVRSAGVTDCWMTDTPTNNYATLNPLDLYIGATGYSNGNLQRSSTPSGGYSTFGVSSGKWYWEWVNTTIGSVRPVAGIRSFGSVDQYLTYNSNGDKNINGTVTAYGASYAVNDVIGVAVDLDGGTVTFYKNGVSQGAISYTFNGLTFRAFWGTFPTQGADVLHVNFGQRSFAYTPPTGYKSLCTANLPTPTGAAAKPSDHFRAITDTGANIKSAVEAIYADQALMIVKDRANVNNWQWFDDARGLAAILQSNTTAAETTYTAPSGSSIGYALKAASSAVTNNAGTISSQVSANTQAGFSVVTYTGTGANATVGHGLGVAPKMIIAKSRTGGANWWVVGHQSISATPWNSFLYLHRTDAIQTNVVCWNNTAPTSSVFSVGTGDTNAGNMVAYCFAEVPGFSKIGSYTGNGSADGPFVYCGFKPRWVLIKRTDVAANWRILDSARDGNNVAQYELFPGLSNAEITFAALDFVSNGFKIRNTDAAYNASGGTYIFIAFAEAPFQYANAR